MEDFKVFIGKKKIQKSIACLAKQIDQKYKNQPLVVVCVLKGAIMFFSELVKRLKNEDLEIDFIQVKSYSGQESTGNVKLIKDLDVNIKNKNLVIIEDIVDTGLTANYLYDTFISRKPKTILMCSLLQKPSKLQYDLKMPLLTGFKIEDKFIIGFGLDLDEKYRNLKDIMILKQ